MMRRWLAGLRRRDAREATNDDSFAASRARLMMTILGVVSAIIVVMALAVYVSEAHAIDQQVDQQIVNWANHEPPAHYYQEQQNFAAQSAPSPDGDGPHHDFAPIYQPSTPNVFSVAIDDNGHVLFDPTHIGRYGLPDVPTALRAMQHGTGASFVTITKGNHTYRLYTQVINVQGLVPGAIQSGMSLDARNNQLHDLVMTLLLVGIGVLALTAGASILLADHALVPTRRAFARQQRFVAAASHELRTPLAIMRSQAELIARRLRRAQTDAGALDRADAATLGDDTHEILDEVDYMTQLVSDLLLLARSPNERQSIAHTPVDVRALAMEVVAKAQTLPSAAHLALRVEAPSEPVRVPGDAVRLRQLILILVDNALQYTPAGGTVQVRVWHEGERGLLGRGRAHISVSDTGVGIAPQHLRQIFEPFFRADPSRTHTDGRTNAGLGLTLAQWIVAAHGGTLDVASTPGVGTTFTITLPLAAEGEAPPPAPLHPQMERGDRCMSGSAEGQHTG